MRLGIWILATAALLAACGGGGGGGTPCDDDTDCPVGATCESDKCVARECDVDASCPIGAVCEGGRCSEGCRDERDCSTGAPFCDTSGGTPGACVTCRTSDDCQSGYQCDDHACVQTCRDDVDCTTGHCDTGRRVCVECTENAHCSTGEVCDARECVPGCDDDNQCPAGAPRCDTDRGEHGTCVECRGNSDCGTGTCSDDGTCTPGPTRALDVLFIVDDSNSMAPEQQALTAAFPTFVNALEAAVGYRPDLHLGVVTTSIAITQFPGSTDCREIGFDGALQPGPGGTSCLQGSDAFLRDVAVPGAGRNVNYAGTLDAAFACMASVGTAGCGFEQPLEVLRRALDGSVARNAGFLRPDAALAVIILSDEDDCSVSNQELFSTTNDTLGPRTSFRCFEYGVRCNPDDPRSVGAKTGCVSRDDSPYVARVSSYVDFLRALRSPERLYVSVLAGPATLPATVSVGIAPRTANSPELLSACAVTTSGIDADPAIRLATFVEGFPDHGSFISACDDFDDALATAGAQAARLLE